MGRRNQKAQRIIEVLILFTKRKRNLSALYSLQKD
jgi:hypothetical protein